MRYSEYGTRNSFGLVVVIMCLFPSFVHAQKITRVPATVQAYESAALYAKVGGYLKSISVDIGDEVTQGQELAILDVPEMQQELMQKKSLFTLAEAEKKQADAKIDEAHAMLAALEASVVEAKTMQAQKQALFNYENTEYQRISGLVASGSIQRDLLDSANYKLKAAQSEQQSVEAHVATAKAKLAGGQAAIRRAEADAAAAAAQTQVAQAGVDYTNQMIQYATIRAPWNGKVTQRMFDTGAFIQSAQGNTGTDPILKLVRDDKVRVVFSISQKDLAGLKKGVKVTLGDIDALAGQTFEGTVSRFSGELDTATRMMRVEVDLDNAAGELKPGFFGYATIHFE